MGCAACATRVEQALKTQKGVAQATVNFAAQTVLVEYDNKTCSPALLLQTVQAAGYDLVMEDDARKAEEKATETRRMEWTRVRNRAAGAALLSIMVWSIQMLCPHTPLFALLMLLLATPVVLWFGRGFFLNAAVQLRHRSAGMDLLVATGTGVAYLYSTVQLTRYACIEGSATLPHLYFESASMIVTFVLIGRLLEARAKSHTTDALRGLMSLSPQTVTATDGNGQTREVRIQDVQVGDLLLAKGGEHVAVDGTVVNGASHVDESMLSGEPIPVDKQVGSRVYAGTINLQGSFTYRADSVGEHTVLAQIIRMVREAQGSKAPIQRVADSVAAVFVPTIMTLSVLTLVTWGLFGGTDGWSRGLTAAVSVLVVACPCALGLATPTAITVGIGRAAKEGILVQDAAALEEACRTDVVVLDKTGTLTTGHPSVTDVCWDGDNRHLTAVLLALESRSSHPLAEAIVHYLTENREANTMLQDCLTVESHTTLPGRGIEATVQGVVYLLGNRSLLESRGIALTGKLAESCARMEHEGQAIVLLADSHEALAALGISDPLKPTSQQAVSELKEMGIEVHMLTGDHAKAAEATAHALGIEHYQAGVLPAQKADFIKELQSQGRHVAMVGDGINDSAALATANLSIAMGQGSDMAMDVAMLTIMGSDLRRVRHAMRLSHITVRTIRQNLFWAFVYNIIGVPVAAGVLYPLCGIMLDPMYAGMAMALSSISVVTNSLRITGRK